MGGEKHGPHELLTIGEVSERTGLPVSALRYYEKMGLIASERTSGNQRRFPRFMLRRISLIAVAKRLGIPLEDVQDALIDVPLDQIPAHDDWVKASLRWKKVLEQRRAVIERLEEELTGCIGCGCLSMEACKLLNNNDELGVDGCGAVRLDVPAPHNERP